MTVLADSYYGCIPASVSPSMCKSNQKDDSHKSQQSFKLFIIPKAF